MIKFRTLKPSEVSVRVDRITAKGVVLLLYKNARVDMDMLDETVGTENWKRSHQVINDNLFCSVSIYDADKKEWVTKQDVGVESFSAKEKGESSDSFKRACVNWGIGRELYTAPFIFVACKTEKRENGKGYELADRYSLDGVYVSHMKCQENEKVISELVICDKKGNVVFSNIGKSKKPIDPEEPEKVQKATDRISKAQKEAIKSRITENRFTIMSVCEKYGINDLSKMTVAQWVDCNSQLSKYENKKMKA